MVGTLSHARRKAQFLQWNEIVRTINLVHSLTGGVWIDSHTIYPRPSAQRIDAMGFIMLGQAWYSFNKE
jgi:hypothetical protein